MRFVLRHGLRFVLTLLSVGFVATLLVEFIPGDPAEVAAGEFATPERVEQIRHELRLDQSIPERYVRWVWDALHGDFGESVVVKPGSETLSLVWDRLPVTLSLAGGALLVALLFAVPSGLFAAVRHGSLIDRALTVASSVALAIPSFVVGLVLVTILAVNRDVFPATGYVGPSQSMADWLHHITLPALALAVVPAAELSRQVRGAMVDTFEQPFVRTARASGLSRRSVLIKHAGKAAAPPALTVFGLQAAALLGGAVVVEQIFVLPGLGSLAVGSVGVRDVPLIQTVVFMGALIVLTVNFLIDIAQMYLQPKSR